MEHVFAVPRQRLFGGAPLPQGFVPAAEVGVLLSADPDTDLFDHLATEGRFLPRPEAEADPTHKQPIPYAAIRWSDRLLVVRRTKGQGEARLHGRHSIGLGGHIEPGDEPSRGGSANRTGELIVRGLMRELGEELALAEGAAFGSPRFLGLINDDRSEVGRVHLGLAFEVPVAAAPGAGEAPVRIREASKMEGRFHPLVASENVWEDLGVFETWSRSLLEGVFLPLGGVNRRADAKPVVQHFEDGTHGRTRSDAADA
jgi:predicted NUDIX family phosphoesterase